MFGYSRGPALQAASKRLPRRSRCVPVRNVRLALLIQRFSRDFAPVSDRVFAVLCTSEIISITARSVSRIDRFHNNAKLAELNQLSVESTSNRDNLSVHFFSELHRS